MLDEQLSKALIVAFHKVYNQTGTGFLEVLYQRCLAIALQKQGIRVEAEVPISIMYDGEPVGHHRLDLVVERRIIVECKAGERLLPVHEQQLMNYLATTGIEVGLLFNFGPHPSLRRLVYEKSKKTRSHHLTTIWKTKLN